MNRTPDPIDEVTAQIESAPVSDLPALWERIRALEPKLLARMIATAQPSEVTIAAEVDEEIDAAGAARRLGLSKSHMYKHWKEWGGAKFGGALRFSTKQLEAKRKRRHYN